jgi:tetratricopeptide (TPR) repeat protein
VAALLAQGEEHLGRGKWAQATEAYRQVLDLVPDYPEAVARLAEAERQEQVAKLHTAAQGHLEAGRWSEAIEGFRAVLELDSTHEGAARQAELARLYTVADEAAQAGDWSKAIKSFQALLSLDASYRDAPARLAQAQEALATKEAARQQEAQLADLLEKATDRMQAGDWPEAEQLLREIRLVNPNYRDVKELLAQVASEREREERLATLYDRAEEHYHEREWIQAVELYEQVSAMEPGYRDVEAKLTEAKRQQHLTDQYAQALEHLQDQRWQEAIEAFKTVVEIDPDYGDTAHGRAANLLTEAQQQKELAELPPPPVAKTRRPPTLPEEIKSRGKPRDLPR